MRFARWKREANSLIFILCCRLDRRHRFAGDTLVFGIDCFRAELGKVLFPDIQRINGDVASVRSMFQEECMALDADFCFRGDVTMFKIFIFVVLLT